MQWSASGECLLEGLEAILLRYVEALDLHRLGTPF
jgi:hypothetical protein